jgi:hypothetical protein
VIGLLKEKHGRVAEVRAARIQDLLRRTRGYDTRNNARVWPIDAGVMFVIPLLTASRGCLRCDRLSMSKSDGDRPGTAK